MSFKFDHSSRDSQNFEESRGKPADEICARSLSSLFSASSLAPIHPTRCRLDTTEKPPLYQNLGGSVAKISQNLHQVKVIN